VASKRAAQIEAAPLRPDRVGGQELDGGSAQKHADGQIDEEDRAPVDELGQHAAEEYAAGGAGAADRAPDAERLGTLGALEGGRDDRQRGRGKHRGTEALTGPGGEQHGGIARERRGQRRGSEHSQAGKEDAPAAEQVSGAPAEKQQAAEDQRVGGDRPANVALGDFKSFARSGSATLTAEMSRMTMSCATDNSSRSDQRVRERAPCALAVWCRPCM
jgi:hypothetical protein